MVGTLPEGIELWGELKPHLTVAAIRERAVKLCHWAIARGTLAIRSHVEVCDSRLLAVVALLAVREQFKSVIDLQLVAFPQDGLLRSPGAMGNLVRALDMGVDVVAGIPHFERTIDQVAESVRLFCEPAADRGLMVDMHCDESDDPWSRHIETLAYHTGGWAGGPGHRLPSHLHALHGQLLRLQTAAPDGRSPGACGGQPADQHHPAGAPRHLSKRRGMTRVKEMLAAGLNVAFGHDCVMDPWYSFGSHDMLEVAHMGLHVAPDDRHRPDPADG